MPTEVMKIENGYLGLSATEPTNADDVTLATLADYDDMSFQFTEGALNASPNTTDETIPATGQEASRTIQTVGQTSYSLDISLLQDPQIAAGLTRFLVEHDTALVWFYFGMDGDDPPKAIGQVRCIAGTVGGTMRTTLEASVSLPCEAKPSFQFGDATTNVVI